MSQDSLPEMAGANAPVNHPETGCAAVPPPVAAPTEPSSPEAVRTEPPASENGNGSSVAGAGPALGPDGLPRRRRRGSRGGRNRKRPGAGVGGASNGGSGDASDDDDTEESAIGGSSSPGTPRPQGAPSGVTTGAMRMPTVATPTTTR